MLHAALRQLVGFHVKQSGSLVAPDRLRFDFTHYAALSPEDLIEIEDLVNRKVMDNLPVTTLVQDLNQAVSEGAMALFGEKYREQVRVVSVDGFSKELCGGTHVSRTGDIGLFKIVSESGIAAGVRRIEAITGRGALLRFREDEALLSQLEGLSEGTRPELVRSVRKYQTSIRSLEKELQEMRYRLAQDRVGQLLHAARRVNDVRVLTSVVDRLDKASLRNLADELKSRIGRGVVVLATSIPIESPGRSHYLQSDSRAPRRQNGQGNCLAGRRRRRGQAGHGRGRRQGSEQTAAGAGGGRQLRREACPRAGLSCRYFP